jgi:hypothetical protein
MQTILAPEGLVLAPIRPGYAFLAWGIECVTRDCSNMEGFLMGCASLEDLKGDFCW